MIPTIQYVPGRALKVRIGIATGIVVVGDLVGQGSAQEQAVVGETPNLAARLQALAEPGAVVIAESTRRLLGGAFELEPLGPQPLKGFDAPVLGWAVLREAENLSRFEASRSQRLTPLVGREHEVALLLDRWREASEGEGQVALISGEAGIGKSRVLTALSERIGDEPHVRVRYQCSPHHVNDAFYPIISQIWHAARFVSGEPAAARLDKLEAMIARSGLEGKDIAPLVAGLLSIPVEGRYPPLEMAPAEQKERTIVALIALFAGLTKDAPALALLEDSHWIDPTSLDVFGRLIDRLPGLRALLVVTFRPEFAAPWVGRAHVASLQFNRFGRREAQAMVAGVAGGKALPVEVLDEIVAKTDGVPLFVEELTKTVLIGFRFSIDPGVSTLCSKIWVLSTVGLHDQAARVREVVRAELPDHKLPGTIALYMQLALAWPELMYGDFEAAERYAAEHVAFCAERKVEQFRLWGANYQASARAMREPTEENIAALRGAIAANNRSGGYFSDSIFKSYLAEALLMRREIAGAEAALQDAFTFVERSGERFWLADLYRVEGQIALRRSKPDRARAEASFLKAVDIARSQEARMLELRAATDLARLWREAGAPNDPRALLNPILAAIEGGETTRDVRNARALLAEIG